MGTKVDGEVKESALFKWFSGPEYMFYYNNSVVNGRIVEITKNIAVERK